MIRLRLLCLLAAALSASGAHATSDEKIQQLIDRLDAAETRIKELEQQQANTPQPDPPAQPVFTPASFARDESDPDKSAEGQDESLKALVSDWEQKWETQGETNDELKSSIRKSVQPGSTGTKSMKISGRIHADYWGIPNSSTGINRIETANPAAPNGNPNATPQDRLGFRRVRFGVAGDVAPNTAYKVEMEFAGANNTEFRDVYIRMKDVSWLQTVTIGNHKRPYGLDHLNSSRYNVFLERPFVIESFNQDARRLGISANGVSEDQAWNWRYGFWNQRLIQDEGNYISDHLQAEFAGRLANTWWYDEQSNGRGYGHWAVSATVAQPDGSTAGDPAAAAFGQSESQNEARFRHRPEARTDQRWLDTGRIAQAELYEIIGLEKVVNVGPLQVVGEYQNLFLQRDAGLGDVHLHGGYVYASYFLTGEHMPWDRKSGTLGRVKPFENFFFVDRRSGGRGTGWGAWQLAVRYSYANFNDKNINGGIGEAMTYGLNWLWNANTRLQFNYINGRITNRNLNGNLVGGPYDIVGARLLIDF